MKIFTNRGDVADYDRNNQAVVEVVPRIRDNDAEVVPRVHDDAEAILYICAEGDKFQNNLPRLN